MDSQRLGFWIEFIVSRSGFPLPQRLATQFAVASFSEFCACGCNSFKVSVPADAFRASRLAKVGSREAA